MEEPLPSSIPRGTIEGGGHFKIKIKQGGYSNFRKKKILNGSYYLHRQWSKQCPTLSILDDYSLSHL